MKTLVHISLLLLVCNLLSGQQLSVKSFRKLPMDMEARTISPRKDQNGEVAALIKISTREKEFNFNGGMMGIVGSVQKAGEIWLYLPKGIQRLTIGHPQLGVLRNYFFPERIEAATTYEMVLTSGRIVTIVEESAGVQFFVLRYTPADIDVDIYIDDVYIKKGENGVVEHRLKYGRHTYKVKAPRYKQVDGVVEIGEQKEEVDISLISLCGTIHFTSTPENGADVLINNKLAGTTPFVSEELEAGEYKIDVKSTHYLPYSQLVTVLPEGKQVNVAISLKPNFATINITANTECEVVVNDISKGLGNQKLRLTPGFYTLEARKSSHRNVKQTIEVVAGSDQRITLAEPTPRYGTLEISANVVDAKVYLNGKNMGATPNIISKILIGTYDIEIRNVAYSTYNGKVTINEGKITTHSVSLAIIPAAAIDGKFVVAKNDLSREMNWENAVRGCRSYSEGSAGVGSWRLPIKKELQRIYHLRSQLEVVNGFTAFVSSDYWSSTENGSTIWCVGFYTGNVNSYVDSYDFRVRCIRDLISTESNSKSTYIPSSSSTKGYVTVKVTSTHRIQVYDRNVGASVPQGGVALNYTNDSDHVDHKNSLFKGDYYTRTEAKTACPSGWRLPTRDEFYVINSKMKLSDGIAYLSDGAGNRCYFPLSGYVYVPDYVSGYYWSSHTFKNNSAYYLNLNPGDRDTSNNHESHGFSVRCVKTVP